MKLNVSLLRSQQGKRLAEPVDRSPRAYLIPCFLSKAFAIVRTHPEPSRASSLAVAGNKSSRELKIWGE